MEEFDALIVRSSLEYFAFARHTDGTISVPTAGAHWFYNILQPGTLYFQKQSDEDSISSDMIQWYNFCHESSSIFVNRGWQHPILVLAMEGSPADKAKWCKYESELVRRERFKQ